MKKNNPIVRTCMVCRTKKNKSELYRFSKTPYGEIVFDENHSAEGRGCYVCKGDCLDKMKKARALSRAYKTNISEETHDKLYNKARESK